MWKETLASSFIPETDGTRPKLPAVFWSLFVFLHLLSLARKIKLGWILGMLSYGNLAKCIPPPTPHSQVCFGSYTFEIVLFKAYRISLWWVCLGGWTQLSQSHFILTQNAIMRPHIGHLRFYVGVLKKPIQSCTRKAEDSNHRLERKTRMLHICPRPKEPPKQIKEGQGIVSTPKAIKREKKRDTRDH